MCIFLPGQANNRFSHNTSFPNDSRRCFQDNNGGLEIQTGICDWAFEPKGLAILGAFVDVLFSTTHASNISFKQIKNDPDKLDMWPGPNRIEMQTTDSYNNHLFLSWYWSHFSWKCKHRYFEEFGNNLLFFKRHYLILKS